MGTQQPRNQSNCNAADRHEAEAFEREALDRLRSDGLRITMPRVLVIRTLSRSNGALGAYEIHERIAKEGGKVDVVTVYRVLQALQESGLVHRIGVLDGYYACRAGGSHGESSEHLICSHCGCVQEMSVPAGSARQLSAQAETVGFRQEAVRVEVLGTCAHCQDASV